MAKERQLLQDDLVAILGSGNVYFDPPESLKIQYPCIVYNWDFERQVHANNGNYLRNKRYQVIHISRQVDDPVVDKIAELPYAQFSRRYTENNLHHTVYDLYF